MQKRRVLMSLILVGALAGMLYLAVRSPEPSAPRWTVARPDVVAWRCADAVIKVSEPPAEPIAAETDISQDNATERLNASFKALNLFEPEYIGETMLVRATLPDGSVRPVWAKVWIKDWMGNKVLSSTPM